MAVTALLGATLGVFVLSPPAAYADNFGSACVSDPAYGCVSLANNAYHAVSYVNIGDSGQNGIPRMAIAADWAVSQYNATDMVVYRDESDPFPDVEIHDWNYGNTWWVAYARCGPENTGTGGTHPYRWCRGQQNRHNSYFYWYASGYYDTDFQRRVVTCHEMGHTVGLRHNTLSSNSCMWERSWQATGSILTGHDIAHINARY